MTSISWLHLSDLHLGQKDTKHLWPTFKTEFYRDIDRLSTKVSGWDLIFFTGDMVQTGAQIEFDEASKELEALWHKLTKAGSAPHFICIPGNHDLERPGDCSPIALALDQWHSSAALRTEFWNSEKSEYRISIQSYFKNYTNWINNLQIPLLKPQRTGILPGDGAYRFTKNSHTLGIIGLNSTFLQIKGGDYYKKIDISSHQLHELTENDPDKWLSKNNLNLLLTHHPTSWLSETSLEHFRQEIDIPGRFFAHLCGHQHSPESDDRSQGGAQIRRTRQAPSLFGLETYNHTEGLQKRTHGYFAGKITLDSDGLEILWPRNAIAGISGALRLRPDQRFDLTEDDSIFQKFDINTQSENTEQGIQQEKPEEISSTIDIITSSITTETASNKLATFPTLPLHITAQHAAIHGEEQTLLELSLRQSRIGAVQSDWACAKHDFISCAITRLKFQSPKIYHINCADIDSSDALLSAFIQQAGISLQAFATNAAALPNCFLLLDNLPKQITHAPDLARVKSIISALQEFCPNLYIIITSEHDLTPIYSQKVSISRLDIPEIRSYVLAHPLGTDIPKDISNLEKIHQRSEGIPTLIDQILQRAQVTSWNSALEDSDSPNHQESPESLPQFITNTINQLFRDTQRQSTRAAKLLKVLSLLPYGEAHDEIKNFIPTEPFFPENVLTLQNKSLIEIIRLAAPHVALHNSNKSSSSLRILKVPRPIREYVKNLITEEERLEITQFGLDLYFGKKWRSGKVKLRPTSIEYQEYLNNGLGNEFGLVQQMLKSTPSARDRSRGLKLGIYYARNLHSRQRFRELTAVTESLLANTSPEQDIKTWAELMLLYTHGIRMLGNELDAIKHLHSLLDKASDSITDDEKSDAWIRIAYAADTEINPDTAIKAANKTLEYAEEKSSRWYEANYIATKHQKDGEEKITALLALEKSARSHKYITCANNIALYLVTQKTDKDAVSNLLDRVLDSEKKGYTRWRGIIAKGEAAIKFNSLESLKINEKIDLMQAYSYLHAQRFGSLFDKCHSVIWEILESEKNIPQLYNLFKHSSFVWRISGMENKEAEYAALLRDIQSDSTFITTSEAAQKYFTSRLKNLSELISKITRKNSNKAEPLATF
jgi:predicted MPP superfamily phosphohydrolase